MGLGKSHFSQSCQHLNLNQVDSHGVEHNAAWVLKPTWNLLYKHHKWSVKGQGRHEPSFVCGFAGLVACAKLDQTTTLLTLRFPTSHLKNTTKVCAEMSKYAFMYILPPFLHNTGENLKSSRMWLWCWPDPLAAEQSSLWPDKSTPSTYQYWWHGKSATPFGLWTKLP